MIEKIRKNRGLIKFVLLVIISILILSYFGFDIKTFIESDKTQGNLRYVWGIVFDIWENVLKPIWVRYINPAWSYFWSFIGPTLENFGEGSLNPFDKAPNVDFN